MMIPQYRFNKTKQHRWHTQDESTDLIKGENKDDDDCFYYFQK